MSDETPDIGAKYRFVPYARRGYRPTTEIDPEKSTAKAQPAIGIDVTPKGTPRKGGGTEKGETKSLNLSMYGPGDVRGIDSAQVVREEPQPGTAGFQPNYFPFVEFDRADLPWMFSPEKADEKGRVRPWLTLITVTDDESTSITVDGGRPSPVLTLGEDADLETELPDLTESWAWAHVQAHASPRGATQGEWYGPETEPSGWLYEELQKTSNLTRSRLLSPRNLQPETDYVACLVPTFEPGRRAALGEDPYDDDASGAVAFAWDKTGLPEGSFELPLFHYWRFTAGQAGTFENLVKELDPVTFGPSVGKKEVDVRDPGPDSLVPKEKPVPESETVDVGGAMYSVPAKRTITEYDQSDRLRRLLNKPENLTTSSGGDSKFPIVGPPLYGQWHAGLSGIPAENAAEYDPRWFRTLNVNVRNRVAASVGTEIVQEYQEQLMSAAWEVVGKVREANKFTRGNQGSEAVGNAMERVDQFEDRVDYEHDEFPNPNEVRREFERIRKIADVVAAGGIDGIDPDEPDGGGDPLDPDGEWGGGKNWGGEIGGGKWGGGKWGGGKNWGGGRWGGDLGNVAGGGEWGGNVVDPVDFLAVGGSVDGNRVGFEDLALSYAGDSETVRSGRRTAPDGGALATGGSDHELSSAAVYTEYLRTFLSQPEASIQFQRLTRLDGPFAKRSGFDASDYRSSMRQASRRAKMEVETLVDTAVARSPEFPAPDDLPSTEEQSAGTVREGPSGSPQPEGESGESETVEDGDDGVHSEFEVNPLVDPETIAALGEGSRVEDLERSPTRTADAIQDLGGAEGVTDRAVTGSVATPETPGVDPTERAAIRPAAALPRSRRLSRRQATRAELDDRVPAGNDEESAETPEVTSESVPELVTGIERHCTAVRGRIDAAEEALSDGPGSPSSPTLTAYEYARPIAFSLDPLETAVSKAIADPEVGVAESLNQDRADEATNSLQESYRRLLSSLTAAPQAASGSDPGSDATESGTGGDGTGAETNSEGARSADGEAASGTGPRDRIASSLSTAEDSLEQFRSTLDELAGLVSPGRERGSVPMSLEVDDSGSVLSAIDPREESTTNLSMDGIGKRLRQGSEGRFRKALLTQDLPFLRKNKEFLKDEDPVDRVMVAPEFPVPTWRLLKEQSTEYVLPGADSIDDDSVGIVLQNREFVESFMVGLSHEVGRELLWRQYPTDRKGTYFQRFWNRGKGPAWEPGSPFELGDPPTKDIAPIHDWNESTLGTNAPGGGGTDKIMLLVSGKLFERYPNTVVYAAKGKIKYDENGDPSVEPATPEEYVKNADTDEKNVRFPMFRGNVNANTTFLAFDLTYPEVYARPEEVEREIEEDTTPGEQDADQSEYPFGWYFVFEERPGETRFGLDEGEPEYAGESVTEWDDMSWYHTVSEGEPTEGYLSVLGSRPGKNDWQYDGDAWGKNSAHMAGITWQTPVRVSYHAHEMLPDPEEQP